MNNLNNIDAVIKLLDDPDEEIYSVVSKKLFDEGVAVIEPLSNTWGKSNDPLIVRRVVDLTQKIQFKHVIDEMRDWACRGQHDLLEGAFWLARYQHPEIDMSCYEAYVESLIGELKDEIHDKHTPLEKISILNHSFFHTHKFARSFSTSSNADNFFLNNVIDSRQGNFFSLGLLYGGIGQRLGLPLLPLNLPDNFALAYLNPAMSHLPIDESSVLFYINPGNNGAIFGKPEIKEFLAKLKIRTESFHYCPMHNIDAVILLLDYLILSFNRLGDKQKAHELRIVQNSIRNG